MLRKLANATGRGTATMLAGVVFVLLSFTPADAQFTAASGSPVAVGTTPQALVTADFNGDGKPDLATANSGSNNVTVLLGNGSGGFSAAPSSPFATGASPQSIAVGDFNGDGKPDLAIANSGSMNVTVLLGTGTGKFAAAPGSPFAVGAAPVFIAVGDFNGDGKADVVTANSGGTISVLLGNGSGGFTAGPGSPLSVGGAPQSLAVADFNLDGNADLVATNLSGNSVMVLLGNGAGGFVAASNSPFAVGVAPAAVAVADLNGDGIPDIVTANSGDNTVTALLGDGSGGFAPATGSPFSVGAAPVSVAVKDFNGDGIPDLVTANSASGDLSVLLGITGGGFAPAPGNPFAAGNGPASVATADFNGDGKSDFAVANSAAGTLTIYLNSLPALSANPASVTFYAAAGQGATAGISSAIASSTSGSTYTVSSNQTWLSPTPASNATGGTTTVNLTANPGSLPAGVYTGTVTYTAPNWFDAATQVTLSVAAASGLLQAASGSPFSVGAGPQSLAVADFNKDGNLDILTANYGDNTVSLLLGDGSGGFTAAPDSPFSTGNSPNAVAVGDVNGDGNLDIVTANSGSNNVTVLLGNGSGGFTPAAGSPFAVGNEPLSVALGDFNRDGKLDLVVANNVDKDVSILLGDGTGGFVPGPGSPVNLGTAPQALAVGDFNGDGFPDLAVAGFNNHVTILLGDGFGGLAVTKSIAVGSFPEFVATADLNADGKLDIVTANFGNNNVSVLLGNGSGGFTAASGSPIAVGMQPQSLTMADVNGDGKLDVISANTGDNTVSILLGNGSGGFTAAQGSPFAAGNAPFAVVVGDFNGDGRPDLAAADVVGQVTVLLGAQVATASVLSTTAAATVAFGASIPLTLTVSGGFSNPTGAVTFLDAGTPIGMAAQQASPYTFNATGLAPGPHTFTAAYPGDSANLSSTSNTVSVSITAAAQTITFSSLAGKSYGTAPFTVSATASSGLPVSFASTTSMVCTVAGATVTLVAVGTCTIQATQAGDSNYAAATPVSQHFTVTQGSQTITFGAIPNQQAGTPPLTLTATASSGLAVSFTASPPTVCTVSAGMLTLVGMGTCTVQAVQAGNADYTAAPSVSQHFTVAPSGQTITFGALANQVFGVPPSMLSATASSGLAVTFASSTAAVCTVSGSTVTLVSVGMCTIKASQAGNSSYAAATPVSQTFNITQGSQTIVFSSLADKSLGGPHFTVSATASSGLTVAFVSNTVPVCTVSGATVTLVAMGSCTLEAQQAGNANYAAAAPVDQSFQVTAGSQTITFGALSTKSISAGTITLSATASSSLPVSFASNTPSVCTVSGNIVTLVITGTCTIEASQAGNASYAAATPVDQSFMVTQGSQTIAFGALSSQPFSATPVTLTATASSGLPVNFTSGSTGICTVAGSSVTLVTVGTCTIQASQPGNSNYSAAPTLTQKFTITQGPQTITFGMLSNQPFGTAPFPVSPTASSGLVVTLSSSTAPVCTVSGLTVTLTAVGTCTLQAVQAGNLDYSAAAPVSQSFTVLQASQTISFPAPADRMLGPPFTAVAAASSGLAVSFASTTASVCTVSGTTVTLVAPGTCTLTASQAGNTNYATAPPVSQSFQVTSGSQTITFGPLMNTGFISTPIPLSATASSGLPVSFASTTASVCTVSGANLTLVSLGTCTVVASQAGSSSWPAAMPVNQSFLVTLGTQTITFGMIANQPYGTPPFLLNAMASSGLTVTFVSSTPQVCQVSGATVTLLSVGTCSIAAFQPGNANFTAAPPAAQSFMVIQASQAITFGALSNQTFGSAVALGASASSGLPVVFAASPATVCAVAGALVTLTGLGTCTITATQPGNAIYAAAMPVPQAFMVTQGSQTIVMTVLANQGYQNVPIPVSATSSSGLPVTLASTTPSVCALSGSALTLLGLGTCTVTATQPGNPNYAAAPTVTQTFMIAQGSQTIAFAALVNQPPGTAPFQVSATASSGLPVVFTSTTAAVCTVTGTTVALLTAGTCTIQAAQAGNALFVAAIPVQQTFTVGPAMNIAAVLNAASYAQLPLAAGAYTVAFGSELAIGTAQTPSVMLPSTLAGTTVTITDSTGATLTAPLYYVSPSQINFLVPSGLASGAATVTVANPNVGNGSFPVTVAPVAPALFTADASGHGVPAAIAFDSTAAGQTEAPPVFSCSGSPVACVAEPIELGAPSTQVFLVLFGTGIRGRSSLAGVTVTAGGVPLAVEYAGAQGTYPGLDQVNVLLDPSLAGRGQVVLQLTVDGAAANPVVVNVM